MQEIRQMTDTVQDWLNGMMLRGLNQLSPGDLNQLRAYAERAAQLHMDELCRLLNQLADTGQAALLGSEDRTIISDYFRLSAYIQMASASLAE
ncbi:hypothetical protein [Paenibacillus dauci]|uniref:hypothetical protein n=1 Tax=Paenibacillus dauci TaxID=1567106 RepID=UPI0006196E39|nr:hypothetical protein [Paenibacillus dauci]